MSSLPVTIAAWPKNSREVLQVRLDEFRGQAVIDCRCWYQGSDGNLKPGRGGLTVAVRHLPALAEATAKALTVATAANLIPGDGPQSE